MNKWAKVVIFVALVVLVAFVIVPSVYGWFHMM